MTRGWYGLAAWKSPCVYILASRRNGTLYVGVTSDLVTRIAEHKQYLFAGFTQRYDVKLLVHSEQHASMDDAIRREKALKRWRRAWKIALIETSNPTWRDLYAEISGYVDVP